MKPIFLTDKEKEKLVEQVLKQLSSQKIFDGKLKLDFSLSAKKDCKKARVFYTAEAWAKMQILIQHYTGEVAWHGEITRGDDERTFVIKDIFVYPQTVTGATVRTLDEEYGPFIFMKQQASDDPDYCINFQGHSHVNFSVSPSDQDVKDQRWLMENQSTGFYVFTIQNKAGQRNYWVYDYDNNVVYEPADVEEDVLLSDGTLFEFLAQAKKMTDRPEKTVETKTIQLPAAVKKEPEKAEKKKNEKESMAKSVYNQSWFQDYYPYRSWSDNDLESHYYDY